MKTNYGNYSFLTTGDNVSLSYNRSSKDYFDIAMMCLISLVCVLGVIFIFLVTKDFLSINTLVLAIFLFASLFSGIRLIAKIQEPTSNLIEFNHKTDKFVFKSSKRISEIIKLSEIRNLNYTLVKTFHLGTNSNRLGKYGHQIFLSLLLNSNQSLEILVFNPNQILETNSQNTEKELIKKAKPIIQELAKRLNKTCSYSGIREAEMEYSA